MATIINNTQITFSVETQQIIRNAASCFDTDILVVGKHPNDAGNDTLFNIFDDNDNLLFSIDIEANVLF